jgi:hypothetical protein
MNPELEAIVNAYGAHLEKPRDVSLFQIYRSRLEDACEKNGVDPINLDAAIKKKYVEMVKVLNRRPPTLPPKA